MKMQEEQQLNKANVSCFVASSEYKLCAVLVKSFVMRPE